MWYFETVKLDLEARRLIERRTDTDPHRYRLLSKQLPGDKKQPKRANIPDLPQELIISWKLLTFHKKI